MIKKIYLNNNKYGFKHRSGWSYAVSLLEKINTRDGILFDTFLERKFAWGNNFGDAKNNPSAYKEEWVGVFHLPDNIPEWFGEKQTPKNVFKNKYFIESLKKCKGLYCLSEYEKTTLRKYTDLPINVIYHPTEDSDVKFSIEKFIDNKNQEIIQMGITLRKLSSIFLLKVKNIKKSAIGMNDHSFHILEIERKNLKLNINKEEVKIYKHLNAKQYDEILSCNITFIDLYEASANNSVIECIIRNTPLLINPHPAVVEYLGQDYPFYFNSLEEAAQKAENIETIKKTYDYLVNLDKEKLTGDAFISSIINSEIYKNLEVNKLGTYKILKRIIKEKIFIIFYSIFYIRNKIKKTYLSLKSSKNISYGYKRI